MAKKTNCIKNGKVYFRITANIGKDTNGKPVRKEFYGKSKKEAEQKKDEYLNKINSGLNTNYNKIYMAHFMYTWLTEVIKLSKKSTTFDRYFGIYNNYIKDSEIGFILLEEIKPLTIQRYYNKLYKLGKSSSTIVNLNKLLKNFFNYCVDNDQILKNPCSGSRITIPREINRADKRIITWTDDEIRTLINAPEESEIKLLALLLLNTGMRRGEALGLKYSDIKPRKNEIHIQRRCKTEAHYSEDLKTKKYIPTIDNTKTYESARVIPLNTSIAIIEKLKALRKEKIANAGGCFNQDLNFIFCTSTGELIDDSNLSRSWKRFCTRNKIEYKNLHSLRHTYATKQFGIGIPVKTVSELLGHSNIETTLNTYTHVLKEHKEMSLDILNSFNAGNHA